MKAIALTTATLFIVAGTGAGVVMVTPTDPNQRPTGRIADCTSSGCHAQETRFRFLHAPVAVGACDVCHVYDDPAQHTFTLKHAGAAMCDFCHIGKSGTGDPSLGRKGTGTAGAGAWMHIHEPVAKGECTACHNPHGSNIRNLVNAESVGQMCSSCHEGAASHAYNHTPVAQGDCTSCHRPHSSVLPGLLVAQGRDLCLTCHQDVVSMSSTGAVPIGSLRPGPTMLAHSGGLGNILPAVMTASTTPGATAAVGFIHDPVLEDCTQCHDHHGTAHAGLLREDTVTLCGSCHESVVSTAMTSKVQHSSVTKDRACLNCHSPHQSMQQHLLRSKPVEMCLDCHATDVARTRNGSGAVIPGMASLIESGQHLHGPLASGECRGCHQVHGAAETSLLSAAYSKELYQPFSEGAYALCFTCHNPDLARKERTTTATNFRHGDLNLHYIHITAQDESGRSCRLCHAPHAGKAHPRLLANVPYGQWTLPMEYTATDTGGSCGAGCHRGREYDRR